MKGVVAALLVAVVAVAANECPSDYSQEKLLTHDDCNKFYMCTYGEPVEMTCWGDLFFNVDTWECDWPENIDCGDRNIPGQEPTTAEPETEPTTAEPETEPTTAEPETEPTTAEPQTEPTTTAEPETESTTTAEPETEPTTTAEPETESTTTAEPETEPTTTAEPETEPTTTAEPETEPTTAEPETEPTTAEPATEPTTSEPETEPTTAEPETEPTTAEPTTAEPTTEEPSTPAPGFLENGCPVDPHVHWLLPVEGDCNGFYYCVWGELVLRACPATLHFNRDIQVCDWPDNAGCTTSINKHNLGQYYQRY